MADKEYRDFERSQLKSPKKVKPKPTEISLSTENANSSESQNNNYLGHPVYHEISYINGQINRMDLNYLQKSCKDNNLDTTGKRETVKRRLKEHYKEQKLLEAGLIEPFKNRNVDYFIVIDFEATCEEKNPPDYQHEIIEFPAVLVSSDKKEIVDIFHKYVRPVINPTLSEFCRTLTGIEQKTVDKAETFEKVHADFEDWMTKKHKLGTEKTFLVITDGPFDMGRFLYLQLTQLKMIYPNYAKYWANIRKVFSNFYKGDFYASSGHTTKLPGLQTMLSSIGLEFEGIPHSGLDDSKNIARVLIRLIRDKAYIRVNERIILLNDDGSSHNACDHVRLKNVTSVSRKDAEYYFKRQQKQLKTES